MPRTVHLPPPRRFYISFRVYLLRTIFKCASLFIASWQGTKTYCAMLIKEEFAPRPSGGPRGACWILPVMLGAGKTRHLQQSLL